MPEKEKIIQQLRQIPDEILENLYSLDIITLKGKMQFNDFLADRYKKYRVLSPDEDWLMFEIGGWVVKMEVED